MQIRCIVFVLSFISLNYSYSFSQNCTEPLHVNNSLFTFSNIDPPELELSSLNSSNIRILQYENNFNLIYEDDFSYFDEAFWVKDAGSTYTNSNFNGAMNCEQNFPGIVSINTAENVYTDAGKLFLVAKYENPPIWGRVDQFSSDATPFPNDGIDAVNYRSFNYSGGGITSKKLFKHGLYEAAIKIPHMRGVYPAFWLWGLNSEIDAFEFWQDYVEGTYYDPEVSSRFLKASYHTWNWSAAPNSGDIDRSSMETYYCSNGFDSDTFIYRILWNEYQICWYINDYVFREVYHYYSPDLLMPIVNGDQLKAAINLSGMVYINKSFPSSASAIKLGNGVSNTLRNCYPNGGSIYQNVNEAMTVEYVKIYSQVSCESDIEVFNENSLKFISYDNGHGCSGSYYNDLNCLPTKIFAQNVTLGKEGYDCIVNNYRQDTRCWKDLSGALQTDNVEIVASNTITLKSGFHAQQGSNFHAHILPCGYKKPISMKNDDIKLHPEINKNEILTIEQKDTNTEFSLEVWPNPCNGILNIKLPSQLLATFKLVIYNSVGEIAFEQCLYNVQIQQIDLCDLPAGIYNLRVFNEAVSFSKKIIVNR